MIYRFMFRHKYNSSFTWDLKCFSNSSLILNLAIEHDAVVPLPHHRPSEASSDRSKVVRDVRPRIQNALGARTASTRGALRMRSRTLATSVSEAARPRPDPHKSRRLFHYSNLIQSIF